MGFNLLPHVVVGVPEDELHRACAVLGVEVVRRPAQVLLAGLEPGPVMVAEDVVQLRLRLAALHVVEVVETLIPLGVGGGLRRGQHPRELQSDQDCVLHLVLGRAWVDVHPVEVHARVGRVEVLVLQLAQLAAIHSVGHRRAEALHVEMVGTLPNLLIRGEAHGNAAVGELRVLEQVLHGGHNLRHTRLVVRPQQGGAVGDDQLLTLVFGQALKLGGPHDDALLLVEHQVAPLVADNAGLHPRPRRVWGGVHVGDKAHARDSLAPGGGGQPGVHIAVLVHVGVVQPHLGQLLGQGCAQHLLLGGGGDGVAVLVGLGIICHVAQKAVNGGHNALPFY